MNLNFTSTILFLKLGLISCLSINELKIDNFLNFNPSENINDKDFLDVDVSSDFLPSITEILDVSDDKNTDQVEKFNFYEKNGNSYQCWVESNLDSINPISGQNEDILKHIILNRKKSCYYFKGKSWVYEYCHLKSARQVSRTKVNDNHEEFSLGRFYPPKRSLSFNRHLNFLSTELIDGSYCELTGRYRTSRIRFICANEKQSMYITNVMETSACSYDYLVHVPELCNYLPKHSKKNKKKSKIKCINYSKKKLETEKGQGSSTKANEKLEGLDQMLGLIESTYKDSSILSQYKSLLLKATEKLKSQQLAKDLAQTESDSSLLDLLTKLSKTESNISQDEENEEIKQSEIA